MLNAKKYSGFLGIFLIITIIFQFSPAFRVNAAFEPDVATVYSEGAYMVNLDTGITVYAKNENRRFYPASTTKIMTAIITMENCYNLDDKVSITSRAFDEFWLGDPNKEDVSNAALEAGQTNVSYRDCLYGLMLPSGCDAANVLALNIAGSIEGFTSLMNAKAQELGCLDTHFSDAHGLWEAENYTTPYDMYLITRYAYDHVAGFMEICDTQSYNMPPNSRNPDGYIINTTNTLIKPGSDFYLEYAHGIKTGSLPNYIDGSGTHDGFRCLVTTAQKNGYTYMLVTMQAPYQLGGKSYNYSAEDHVNLYEWAFDNFVYQTVVEESEICKEVDVLQGEENRLQLVTADSFSTLLPRELAEAMAAGDSGPLQRKITMLYDEIVAPVSKGELIGQMEVVYQGETIATMNLVAARSIERSQVEYIIDRAKSLLDTSWFVPLLILLGALLLLQFILLTVRRRRLVLEARRNQRRQTVRKIGR